MCFQTWVAQGAASVACGPLVAAICHFDAIGVLPPTIPNCFGNATSCSQDHLSVCTFISSRHIIFLSLPPPFYLKPLSRSSVSTFFRRQSGYFGNISTPGLVSVFLRYEGTKYQYALPSYLCFQLKNLVHNGVPDAVRRVCMHVSADRHDHRGHRRSSSSPSCSSCS